MDLTNKNSLIGKLVCIKNSSNDFGRILCLDYDKNEVATGLFVISTSNGNKFLSLDDFIVQPEKSEVLDILRFRLKEWHKCLPGCSDKTCYSCARQQKELDEALNLLSLLEVL